MLLRIFTALVLIPIVVALVWWGPAWLLAAVAALIAIVALLEFFDLGERIAMRPFRKWTIICAAGLFYAQYSLGQVETHSFAQGYSIVRSAAGGVLSIEAALLVFGLATRWALHEVLPAIAISSAGLLFVILPFSYLVRINEISLVGRRLVLFTLCLIWAGDILAYFVGKGLGRVPMAPALSPKKTWEGALGNLLASLLVGVFFAKWLQMEAAQMLVIAGLANIAGQMGDLIESAWKRGAAVKDSSNLLPGHGGVLDRIDSLILASPIVWAAYQWFAK
jgi:phosphatidate cytidylyltransferase